MVQTADIAIPAISLLQNTSQLVFFFSNNCACIPLAYESSKCEKTFFLQLHYVMFLTLGHQSNGGEKDWQLETPALMDVIANTAIVCKTSLQQHGYHFQDSICCPLEIGTYYPYQKSRLMTSLKTCVLNIFELKFNDHYRCFVKTKKRKEKKIGSLVAKDIYRTIQTAVPRWEKCGICCISCAHIVVNLKFSGFKMLKK